MKTTTIRVAWGLALLLMASCQSPPPVPVSVQFDTETLRRVPERGDNWCITWARDGSQITSMDDGDWFEGGNTYHNRLYRIIGGSDDFSREEVVGYPRFVDEGKGWFGYGIYSVNGTLYSMVSRTPSHEWDGPFLGVKMLRSADQGKTWYRVNKDAQTRLLAPGDTAREEVSAEEMFFLKEFGVNKHGKTAYPFSFCDFVQRGQDNAAAQDEFTYVYAPEGAQSNYLLLARVNSDSIAHRSQWEYFSGWEGENPTWTPDIRQRKAVHVFPEKNEQDEYFGWYSWLPSVVWNPGLELYIMVNGGTYAGYGITDAAEDYYDRWMHTRTGSLGFWYAEHPYGPWKKFYYTDYWTVDDDDNLTYQPKLSPKWISDDGRQMTLIWSDAMKNESGRSHNLNYLWNQMEIEIQLK